MTLPCCPKAAGIGNNPALTPYVVKQIMIVTLHQSVNQQWCPSLVAWAVLLQCSVSKPVRRIKASILSQLQKKPFRSIIHPQLVTLLISLPHMSPQTASTRGLLFPLHIYPPCRVGYLTQVRQSISDQQQPKKKKNNKKRTFPDFSLFISSCSQSRPFSFYCDWHVINFSERPRETTLEPSLE